MSGHTSTSRIKNSPQLLQAQRRREIQREIEKELARRELARRRLIEFCQFVDPNYDAPPHLRRLADKLAQVERYVETRGAEGIGRLIINMPPRHGKSESGSKRWPAFLLGRHPDWHIALVAYG